MLHWKPFTLGHVLFTLFLEQSAQQGEGTSILLKGMLDGTALQTADHLDRNSILTFLCSHSAENPKVSESMMVKNPVTGYDLGSRLSGYKCRSILPALQGGAVCYCLQLLQDGQALLRSRLLLSENYSFLHASNYAALTGCQAHQA